MEKVRQWCGQPSDRGRLKNRNRNRSPDAYIVYARLYGAKMAVNDATLSEEKVPNWQ